MDETGTANATALRKAAAGGKEAISQQLHEAAREAEVAEAAAAEQQRAAEMVRKAQVEAQGGVYIGLHAAGGHGGAQGHEEEGAAAVAMLTRLLASATGESQEARDNRDRLSSSSWIKVHFLSPFPPPSSLPDPCFRNPPPLPHLPLSCSCLPTHRTHVRVSLLCCCLLLSIFLEWL